MVKPGPIAPGEHNKVESKKLHKLGRFPKLRAAGKAFSLFLFFSGNRLRIEISLGRVSKKAYLACSLAYLLFFCCRSRIKKSVGRITKKGYLAFL